jgi:predicted O-methyltransferase YrrM
MKNLFTWPTEKPNVTPNNHNWLDVPNMIVLNNIISDINPKYILELGSWTGAGSTKHILDKAQDAHMICVDHWSKDYDDYVQKEYGIEQVKNELGNIIPILWETFLVNTWDYQDRLTPVRAKTVDGLKILGKLNIPFDLIYIDAHHDYKSVLRDIDTVVKLWPNAIVVGDDYTWDGVKKAVHEFADCNNLEVITNGNCWYYKKDN